MLVLQEEELVEALEHYIRVEQKIRLHDVNRYEHLAERDPKEADAVRQQIIDHLHMIDVRIQDTLDLLGKLPQHEKKIRMQMGRSYFVLHSNYICGLKAYKNETKF